MKWISIKIYENSTNLNTIMLTIFYCQSCFIALNFDFPYTSVLIPIQQVSQYNTVSVNSAFSSKPVLSYQWRLLQSSLLISCIVFHCSITKIRNYLSSLTKQQHFLKYNAFGRKLKRVFKSRLFVHSWANFFESFGDLLFPAIILRL